MIVASTSVDDPKQTKPMRGGSWDSTVQQVVRSAARYFATPLWYYSLGRVQEEVKPKILRAVGTRGGPSRSRRDIV